jgi:hypothetical protein
MNRIEQNCGDPGCCTWMEDGWTEDFKKDQVEDEYLLNLNNLEEGVDYIFVD